MHNGQTSTVSCHREFRRTLTTIMVRLYLEEKHKPQLGDNFQLQADKQVGRQGDMQACGLDLMDTIEGRHPFVRFNIWKLDRNHRYKSPERRFGNPKK